MKFRIDQLLVIFVVIFGLALWWPTTALALTPATIPLSEPATMSASAAASLDLASNSAELATTAAQVIIQEKKDKDITETGGKQKDELVAYLEANPIREVSPFNFLQHAIRRAIVRGVPANTIVLLLMFPIISFFIALSRHMIGLRGFGVYTPAVLAVAFVSTGILNGIVVFVIVLLVAMLAKKAMKPLKLQYLPRTALMMWAVSIGILMFLLVAGYFGLTALYTLNIFTILIIMLLSENFMETQLVSSQSEAIRLTAETILLAVSSSFFIGSTAVQRMVIVNPELALLAVAVLNIMIGKYSGLRLLEYLRFRSIIDRS